MHYDHPWELEGLRRSLVMWAADGPVTALSNRQATELVEQLQFVEGRLGLLQGGLGDLLERHSPVPRQNDQLRQLCLALSHLLGCP